MNLFLSTRKLTPAREDHLTEFLAATLESDLPFREAYAQVVIAPFAARSGWPSPVVKSVSTQVQYPEHRCRPDLWIELESGQRLICEHKLDATETELLSETEDESLRQLRRYLDLEVDGVAYFRASWKAPESGVLAHPKYVAPLDREHFLWEDLYHPLGRGNSMLSRWLREGFEALGYTPAHGRLGELHGEFGPPSEDVVANRRNFSKLWGKTRSLCLQLGWKVEAGSICELYLRNGPCSTASLVYLSPLHNRGRTLLLRVVPGEEQDPRDLLERFAGVAALLSPVPEVELVSTRSGGQRPTVDVRVPLRELLPEEGTPHDMEDLLLGFVEPLVRVASSASQSLPR